MGFASLVFWREWRPKSSDGVMDLIMDLITDSAMDLVMDLGFAGGIKWLGQVGSKPADEMKSGKK